MSILQNPWRKTGLPAAAIATEGEVRSDPKPVRALLAACPAHCATPLVDASELAAGLGLGKIFVKDERSRMNLGSFKALGAAHAIAREAVAACPSLMDDPARVGDALAGRVYVAASAGNHGLSIAAGARVFGARAVIFLAETVPENFAERLRGQGADVVREGAEYEASLKAASAAAMANGWTLLSDTSWPGYSELPLAVMEGYLVMADEAADDIQAPPSHIFLQAGVGGLAAAAAASARARWGQGPQITVVEPAHAPALLESIRAGKPVATAGPVSNMGRLDCKEPSELALKSLARDADTFMTVSDSDCAAAIGDLAAVGLRTSPSGGAGYAGLKAAIAAGLPGFGVRARVLLYLSEGAADD